MAIRPGVRRLFRLRGGTLREELDNEITTHLEHRVQQLTARGLTPEAARVEAERRFGGTTELYQAARERERRRRVRDWLETVQQDARFAIRSVGRNRGFSAAVIATLALGIGATVAIVSVVDGVLLRPLPYAQPDELYALVDRIARSGEESMSSPLELNELRRRVTAFSALAGIEHDAVNLTGGGPPQQLAAQRVSANFFKVLGVAPRIGRDFREGDDREGAAAVVVLGHDLWQSRFGGDAGIVGRTVQIDGRTAEVLGVMPAGFAFGNFRSEVWLPLSYDPDHPGRFLHLVGRLKDGATPERAEAELDGALASLTAAHPLFFDNVDIAVQPLRTRLVGDARPVLLALAGAVVVLLVIASANVANLLLARSLRRQRELAVRLSIGAGRWRLVRQLLTESAVLAVLGGAAGVLLAAAAVHLFVTRLPGDLALPRATELSLNGRIVLLAFGVTAVATTLFGLAPAVITASGQRHALVLRGGRGNTDAQSLGRARSTLVVAQVALVLVLLTGAALLARSLWKLQRVELGLDTSEVLGVTVTRADQRYPAAAETRVFFSELLERVAVTPGVAAVGMVQHLPLTGQRSSTSLGDAGSGGQATFADIRTIAGSFFQATGSRLIAGRTFTGADRENSPNVFIVNRTLARNLGGDVLGRRISFNWGEVVDGKVVATSVAGQVVGIVADVRESGPAVAAAPALYRPFAQDPWPTMSLVVRKGTATADAALAQRISAHVQELDPDQPVVVQPLRGAAAALLARPRMQLILVTAFAGLALLLAGVGLYGVIAFAVDQRRQEIGVRLALGATPEMISRIILQHGLVLTAAGLLAGSAIALIALPLLRSLVYGVSLADPIAISGAAVFVMLVSLLASVIPARRAARLDPLAALRPD